MGDELSIYGGADSLDAHLDDLVAAAHLLDAAGDDLRQAAALVGMVAADPALLAAGLLCPVEAVATELALLSAIGGPEGVGVWGLAFETVAVGLRASVATYRAAEEVSSAAFERLRWTGGELVGGLIAGQIGSAAWWGGASAVAAADAVSDGGVRRALGSALYDRPEVTEHVLAVGPAVVDGIGVPGLAGGAIRGLPTLPDLLELRPLPDGYADLLHRVLGLGGVLGAFLDGGPFRVRAVPRAGPTDQIPPATGVADLLREQSVLGDGEHDGMLTVRRVIGVDGTLAWVVQIPGTQDWSLARSSTPVDLTSDVRLMAGEQSELGGCVAEALRQAGVRAGEPVLLTGHSLGGIAAAALASDPGFTGEFQVTAVLTAGAPAARFAIPDGVAVLSLEHAEDLVPMLDGGRNPAADDWVTVRHRLGASTGDPAADFAAAHDTAAYTQTAALVDQATDASILAWRERMRGFFTGAQSAARYQITREPG